MLTLCVCVIVPLVNNIAAENPLLCMHYCKEEVEGQACFVFFHKGNCWIANIHIHWLWLSPFIWKKKKEGKKALKYVSVNVYGWLPITDLWHIKLEDYLKCTYKRDLKAVIDLINNCLCKTMQNTHLFVQCFHGVVT